MCFLLIHIVGLLSNLDLVFIILLGRNRHGIMQRRDIYIILKYLFNGFFDRSHRL